MYKNTIKNIQWINPESISLAALTNSIIDVIRDDRNNFPLDMFMVIILSGNTTPTIIKIRSNNASVIKIHIRIEIITVIINY